MGTQKKMRAEADRCWACEASSPRPSPPSTAAEALANREDEREDLCWVGFPPGWRSFLAYPGLMACCPFGAADGERGAQGQEIGDRRWERGEGSTAKTSDQ